MAQPFADKCAAIISLLESVFAHLDYVPGAMHVQHYGEADDDQGRRAHVLVNVDCMGRCFTCLAAYARINMRPACPPEEKWLREYVDLRRRYRIADVEKSLLKLSWFDNSLAQAVWAVHVEPWPDPKTEPIHPGTKEARRLLAIQGVQWLAHDLRGDVLAYGEKPEPRGNQIRQLISQGYTWKRVCRDLQCSRRDISEALLVIESTVSG